MEVAQEQLDGLSAGDGTSAYYAGAISAMFLLFASMSLALGLVDERQSGIRDRLAVNDRAGMLVLGKFLFGIVQGTIQVALIFATAWFARGFVFQTPILLFLTTCLFAAGAASALALALAATCSTRQQAQMISTFAVLLVSALGGSMVPLFLMPEWLRGIGRFTPNAWMISALQDASSMPVNLSALGSSWAVLAGIAGLSLWAAHGLYESKPTL